MLRKQLLRTSALVAAASISTAAVADVKVSGYQEWNYLDAGASFKSTLGALTGLTFSGSGDMITELVTQSNILLKVETKLVTQLLLI